MLKLDFEPRSVGLECGSVSRSVMSNSLWACQAPLSMEFSRQKYWMGCHFLLQGILPNPGIEPGSPVFQEDSLPAEPPGKPSFRGNYCLAFAWTFPNVSWWLWEMRSSVCFQFILSLLCGFHPYFLGPAIIRKGRFLGTVLGGEQHWHNINNNYN